MQDEIAVLGTQVNFLTIHIAGSYFCNVQVLLADLVLEVCPDDLLEETSSNVQPDLSS